jgi:hypothetical protein
MSESSSSSPSLPERPPAAAAPGAAPVPRTFVEYLRSFGPGIVVVLTWLGAGDIIDMGVAGANYGYSLMWVLVAALFFRCFFVCLLARPAVSAGPAVRPPLRHRRQRRLVPCVAAGLDAAGDAGLLRSHADWQQAAGIRIQGLNADPAPHFFTQALT